MAITTGAAPHEKVITPPFATAATTAAEVQLAAVPFPTTVVGCDVSTARAAAGIAAWPSGLPNDGSVAGAALVVDAVVGFGDGVGVAADDDEDPEDDARGGVAPAAVVGVSETEVVERAAAPVGDEAEEAEPQAAALIDKATTMTACEARKRGRWEDTSRD